MQTLQHWSDTSAFFIWLRESPSILAYPTVFFVHTLGLVLTAGMSLVVSARMLGVAPALPMAPFARLFRVAWTAFWVTAVSGAIMLGADPQTKLVNPVFPVKMVLVAAAVVLLLALRPRVERASTSASTRALALGCLLCWLGAVAAGKFMAYF